MEKIGLTTTVPIEIWIAAGYLPVDLNNIFVTSKNYQKYIEIAERDGFPKSICAWIKGLYGVCIDEGIKNIAGVIGGDCSNTKALVDLLEYKGINIFEFSYPYTRHKDDIKKEMDRLMKQLNVSYEEIEKTRIQLNEVRNIAIELDTMGYLQDNQTGLENHLILVNCSDFQGDVQGYKRYLLNKKEELAKREKNRKSIRLGYIGVPPMTADLYDYIETLDSKVIYNEVQREFAFPRNSEAKDIYEQYLDYTYPYDSKFRIQEIKKQIEQRKLDGIIHYTQAFCHRAIDDIIIKANLDIPVINIEGDQQNTLDARTKLRLEAFIDMLKDMKEQ